ncbi:DAK2 domain-containing protein [Aureimonas ureilytica]|uniref:DAK2 domain-containing protein n=1 Tax=Aureimonas ureilytica TaxID=401562 RepID=UPI0003606D4C|nr:DAK2 domain-containing protein [Aureimonas ureilytica]
MDVTVGAIAAGAARARKALLDLEQTLNAADAKLGDGDTGSMLVRLSEAMAASGVERAASPSEAFGALARAAMAATGSSLGTLVATALMTLSKRTRGRDGVDWTELSGHLAAARDACLARGGAALGDKTVLDALDALATALDGVSDAPSAHGNAAAAGEAVLAEFRDRPCRMGRAKFFAERSVGLDDPGMLALVRVSSALSMLDQTEEQRT